MISALLALAVGQVISSGPTLAFMELRPGYAQTVQVAAGAGYQLSVGFFQTNTLFGGEETDLLDFGAAVYGSDVTNSAGQSAGTLGCAVFVGTLNELVAVGLGEDIISSSGGAFALPPYATFMLNLQRIEFGTAPAVPSLPGVNAARRFMTTYLGF
jgi:hypothetical protein